jgi:hypothetical protein
MNQFAAPNPAQVPTLTEVIELLSPTPVGDGGMHSTPRQPAPQQGSAAGAPIVTSGLSASPQAGSWTPMSTVVLNTLDTAPVPPTVDMADLPVLQAVVTHIDPPEPQLVLPEITEAQLAQRVLADVQKQIDGMLDFRLREALAPILARHSDALVRDLREELSRTMRDVVARSVTQEMAKLRQR